MEGKPTTRLMGRMSLHETKTSICDVPAESLSPVKRRAQARVKAKRAKAQRLEFLESLARKGFRSPEHYQRYQESRKRSNRQMDDTVSWNDCDSACAAKAINLSERKIRKAQNIEMNECEVLDTMQSEFLDVQQAVYVTTRRDVVEKYLEREHCMREDFRSKIIRVQREAANMKVEMKQCLTKRKEGLGSFKSLHEHKLGEFDRWYEDLVKRYAQFTETRMTDWEASSSLKQQYRRCCLKEKTPICSMLYKRLADKAIHLPHYGLGDQGATIFANVCMRTNRFLQVLNLADNALADDAAFALSHAICPGDARAGEPGSDPNASYCGSLKEVDLSHNHITGHGFAALVSATVGVRMTKDRFRRNRSPQKSEMPSRAVMARKLSANLYKDKCSLETLRMKQNHIGDHADVVFVFEVYLASSYCSLKCLDVSYNGIGPTVGKALGVAMRLNRQLLEVVARWNDLEGSNSTIANGLRDNDRLLSLDLAYTAFGNSSAMVLAKSLKFATSNLRSLLLAENTIGPVGCNALCRALQINKNVQMIDLTGNPIEEQGLVAVSRLLKNNSILEYVGLDLLRTNVKLGMYGAGARDAPPGTPPVDKNVVRALQRIRRDERVVGDGGIGPFKLFQDVHSTSFIVSPRWIDEGISEVDLHAAKKFHLSGVEVTGEDDVYGFHNESLLRPTRHPFQRSNYPDVQRVVVHDVRAAGDAERLPLFPREPFLASMVGDQQSWGEDRLLVHFPASVGPKIDIKSKGPRAGEAQNYRCQVTLVNSIEGPGLRYSVTQLFHTRVESLLPAGSRAASRQGWRSKVVKNKPVTTEIIPMAVLAREDDFEDEYEAKEDIDDEEMEEALLHANLGSLVIGSEEEEEGPVVPGEPGRMRKLGLEFVWPTKYLPDVSVGSIVCFEFKTIETHGIKREGVSSIPYLNNIYTNQVERYGIEKPPIVPVEKEEDTESEEEEESNSRYGRSRGSTRSSARSGQSSRRSNRKK